METTGTDGFDLKPVRESVSILMEGRTEYEFRTTAVAELHDDQSFEQIGIWIRGASRYYLQRFKDRETVPFQGLHEPSKEQMYRWLEIVRTHIPSAEIRGME